MPSAAVKTNNAYQAQHGFEERCAESARLRAIHPGMVPVVCEAASTSPKGGRVFHTMVPSGATVEQLRDAVRGAAELAPNTPVSLAMNDGVPSNATVVGELYAHFKDADGFLYLKYTSEQKFGFIFPCVFW